MNFQKWLGIIALTWSTVGFATEDEFAMGGDDHNDKSSSCPIHADIITTLFAQIDRTSFQPGRKPDKLQANNLYTFLNNASPIVNRAGGNSAQGIVRKIGGFRSCVDAGRTQSIGFWANAYALTEEVVAFLHTMMESRPCNFFMFWKFNISSAQDAVSVATWYADYLNDVFENGKCGLATRDVVAFATSLKETAEGLKQIEKFVPTHSDELLSLCAELYPECNRLAEAAKRATFLSYSYLEKIYSFIPRLQLIAGQMSECSLSYHPE
ncbi:MAG: hypothetical protein LBJ89_03815 [Holosporales bacterium]|jgi:hypothetical protein|nr:hypothetical protein [Holosporales bacterium]